MSKKTIHGGLDAYFIFLVPALLAVDGWTMRGRLVGMDQALDIETEYFAPDGLNWALDWPAEKTNQVKTGAYVLQIIAENDGKTRPAGKLAVDAYAADADDLRTQNERILDAYLAEQEARASNSAVSMSGPAARSISYKTDAELMDAIKRQRRLIASEQTRATGKPKIQTQHIRFTNV